MPRRLLLLGLLVVVGCTPLAAPAKVASAPRQAAYNPHHCADVLAQAFASPDTPVPGAWACLNSSEQSLAADSGIYDDVDIQHSVAQQEPVFNVAVYCGRAANRSYVYALSSTDGTNTERLAFSVAGGLVDAFNGTPGSGCPQGLR